ncbi:MAG TPA: MCE family protein [Acidimicrobiales bacterium]|nr:MCE family protein [Acidimicrobiales bacterium]
MKRFRERNRVLVGLVGVVLVLGFIAAALEFQSLPLIHHNAGYTADFANAAGLAPGDVVTIDGVSVGSITAMTLQGDHVLVSFTVADGDRLGSSTSAAADVLSPVGTEYLAVDPSGPGTLHGVIPQWRTTVPYNLVTDLSGLSSEIQHYNLSQIETAFDVGSQDLNGTSASATTSAFQGLADISQVIGNEGSQLASIVSQGANLSAVLSQRSGQLFDLFGQSNLVLSVIEQRRSAVQQLLSATSSLSQQVTAILSVNRPQLTTLLQDLQSVSAVLAKDSNDFGQAIPVLAAFSRYAANASGSGPFVDAADPTLLVPDNLLEQCAASGAYPSSNPLVGCRP